ncbi:unnamed protein product [Linum tenue]|uniref:Uncharacterized protein n=1 Tax=Linum tenue TaxID=586396 RepID=A0AAV0N817_9ROSI|nr:unnamed protein product [Linum tenue]
MGGTIGLMKKLQELDLTEIKCENLTEVLVDIDQLSSLTILKTIRANQDPDDSSSLRKRNDEEELSLARVPTTLKALHTSSKFVNLSELLELQEITVEDCDYGLQIPPADQNNAWWEESKLEVVSLTRTKIVVAKTSTTKLPTSLTSDNPKYGGLKNDSSVKELCVRLSELNSLEQLQLVLCTSLERLILHAAGFKRLKELDIRGCKNLAPRDLSALGAELLNVNIRWPDEECIRYGEGPSFFMDDPLESMCTMQ